MKVGILSDTHGQLVRTDQAIKGLKKNGVAAVLHAGDVGDVEILTRLAAAFQPLAVPVYAVAGNVDLSDESILSFPRSSGLLLSPTAADLTLGGRRLLLTHGHNAYALEKAIAGGQYHYVIHGHTHEQRNERIGNTRVINPGAIQRTPEPGFAVLDLASDQLQFLALEAREPSS